MGNDCAKQKKNRVQMMNERIGCAKSKRYNIEQKDKERESSTRGQVSDIEGVVAIFFFVKGGVEQK